MERNFATWLMHETENRGWTNAELARRAGISPASISMVISGQKGVGLDFCLGVARALGFPPEIVLRQAGLLPPIPPAIAEETEIVNIIRSLTVSTRRLVITMLRALGQNRPPTADPLEQELLESFRRLPEHRQTVILHELAADDDAYRVRLIGEDNETAANAP
jgi:transcriptional regulator with XRE-family HTH domain